MSRPTPAAHRRWIVATLLGVAMAVAATELPDADFLEYLGSWEEEESDWLALAVTDGIIELDVEAEASVEPEEEEDEG